MVGRLLLLLAYFAMSPTLAAESEVIADAPGHRVALVVGNSNYDDGSAVLENPIHDATAIARKFRALGFEVIEAIDLDYREMREALRRFDRALQDADVGLFYYAGHAMEYRGQNYLFPTDAILETEGDVGLGLVDMDQVLQVMETAVPTRLIFLDACRNNPLARNFRSSLGSSRSGFVGRGLGQINTAIGTFIAYATAPGDVAADGRDKNSPFTKAMLTHLDEPGVEISQLMQRVRNSVVEATNQKQVPWDSSSLRSPFILNLDVTINLPPAAAQSESSDNVHRAETVFWESIKDSSRIESFEAYLDRFGDEGLFVPLALARIEGLRQNEPSGIETRLDFDRLQVQKSLKVLGFDPGEADGILGPKSRKAIAAWQEAKNESVTGYLSVRQISRILIEAKTIQEKIDLGMYGFLEIGKRRKRVKWRESVELTPSDASSFSDDGAQFEIRYSHREYAGVGPSAPFSNEIIYNGSLVSKQALQQLDPLEIAHIETEVHLEFEPGTLEIIIDADNTNDEFHEGNNGPFWITVSFRDFGSDSR